MSASPRSLGRAAVALFALMLPACSELSEDVAIHAGTKRLTVDDLRVVYANLEPSSRPPLATREQRVAFARRVLERTLLAEEGRRLMAADSAAVASPSDREREGILMRRLRVLETGAGEVDSSEAALTYEKMRIRRRIQVITFADEQEAQAARSRLDGGESFEALRAQEIGMRPEPESWVAWIPQLDPVADAIAETEPGDVVGPVRARHGWVLIRVLEQAPHDPGTIDELRIQIHQGLKGRRELEAVERLVERLRREQKFAINDAAIAPIVARTQEAILAPGTTENDPDWAIPVLSDADAALHLAEWQGGALTGAEYVTALRGESRSQRPRQALQQEVRRAIGQIVNTRLLVAEAERRGLLNDWWVARALERLEEERAVQRGILEIDRVARAVTAEPDSMIQLLQKAWPDLFRTPPRVRILRLDLASRAAGEAERERIRQAGGPVARLREILNGMLVADGTYHLLMATRGELPKAAGDEIFASGPGTVTGPHVSGESWVVLCCLELLAAEEPSRDTILAELRARENQSRNPGRVAEWIASRERELGASIDESVLDTLTPGG